MSPGSGRRWATTTTGIPGVSSATGATETRVGWRPATVREVIRETSSATTLVLDVPTWPGHRAGQHVDLRLTAEDGYQAQRSYSIASAPEEDAVAVTVERLDDGEVSPYLVDEAQPGDQFEVGGPGRAASTRRRRLRPRAADVDAASPPARGQRRRGAPAAVGAPRAGRALRGRARRAR